MIRTKRILLLGSISLFLCFAVNVFAEKPIVKYYEYASKARYYYYLGKYKTAVRLLDSAFSMSQVTPLYPDYYCMSLCYLKLHKKKKAVDYLERCIKGQVRRGLLNVQYRVEDSTFEIKTQVFAFIQKDPETRQKISSLLRSLYEYKYMDTAISLLNDSVEYYFANDSYWYTEQNRQNLLKSGSNALIYIDTVHLRNHEDVQKGFVDFIKRNGYPGLRKAGVEIMIAPLAHLSKERKDELLPILEKAWEEGNMTPEDYGFFLERRKMDDGGSWCGDYYVIHTVCNANEWPRIRANRRSIGLSDYLDWGDYFMTTFSKPRSELPWVKKHLK
ncbi:tetratricopeptide repeat protein [Taibaiella soli]|uniref:Tetratricopeptide repeat protein n=1 Tax=Taibaiella soli TaxID=1649169 RepID=A0A2W2ABX2_9BACT|nr:hypothetical protein [Taibaiella soli]PZF72915.1 hypothetical protein DN068_10920 [Taibaiella soli]